MKARGYMVDVELTGDTLTAEGTTKAGQVALRGQERNEGPVIVSRSDIERVEWKPANALVNGKVTVHTVAGKKYQLHFRKKQAADFEALARELGAL